MHGKICYEQKQICYEINLFCRELKEICSKGKMKAMKGVFDLMKALPFTRYRLIHQHYRKKMKGLNLRMTLYELSS